MKVTTSIKAGGHPMWPNHNEALVRVKARGLRVKTSIQAGSNVQEEVRLKYVR